MCLDCLLTSMAAVHVEDVRASFLFVGDLNAIIRSGWDLRPRIVMVLQPLTSQLCLVAISWLSPDPFGTLDLVMTDVPDLVRVVVTATQITPRWSFRWLTLFQTCVLVGKC